jgi:DNA transformation protein
MAGPRTLAGLLNLGPKTAAWLAEVGIESEAELRRVGAIAAYRRLKHARPREVSLNARWALHGALIGTPWSKLDAAAKARLRAAVAGDRGRALARPRRRNSRKP